jgi:ribosomal protein S18 acetylase RimI-like enzyme
MPIDIRPVDPAEVDRVVDVALRAWEPVHASMGAVLGARLNRRVYPDWAASQAADVRDACANPNVQVSVAAEGTTLLGFVSVVIDASDSSGEIDMIAVDPQGQGRGIARALTDHAVRQMRDAGCTLAHVATGGDPGHAPARALYRAAGFTALPLARYYREL